MTARILIVDDIAANVRLLEAKLSAEYFQTLTASSGRQALEIIEAQVPDIVLLDVMMPEMDGFEVCKRIRVNPKTRHLPVIMVTALSERADRVRGLEAGADDFLTKPVNDLALFARVRSLVRLKMTMDEWRMREQTSSQFDLLGGAQAPAEEDARNARILLVERSKPVAQAISAVLAEDSDAVAVAQNLAEAQAMAEAGRYDLIMTNIQVGVEDGLQLCARLRAHEETRQIPILIIIEAFDVARLVRGFDIGASDYLIQPIDPNELLARVRIQIRRHRYQERLRANYERSLSLALIDPLTGLYNRRYALRHLDGLMQRVTENKKPLAVMLCDIDHFKAINDRYGHVVGDQVLRQFAERASAGMRNVDMLARFGGEEFIVLMPDTAGRAALMVAKRLCHKMAAAPFVVDNDLSIPVTVSIGISATAQTMDGNTFINNADMALYRAKREGRNRAIADPAALPSE